MLKIVHQKQFHEKREFFSEVFSSLPEGDKVALVSFLSIVGLAYLALHISRLFSRFEIYLYI